MDNSEESSNEGYANHSEEVPGELLVACPNPASLLQPTYTSFDDVAIAVGLTVKRVDPSLVGSRRNHDSDTPATEPPTDSPIAFWPYLLPTVGAVAAVLPDAQEWKHGSSRSRTTRYRDGDQGSHLRPEAVHGGRKPDGTWNHILLLIGRGHGPRAPQRPPFFPHQPPIVTPERSFHR